MDILDKKEEELEERRIEHRIQDERTATAEAKSLERSVRRKYGPDWRKILGIFGSLVSPETRQSLYSVDPSLRQLHSPSRLRKL